MTLLFVAGAEWIIILIVVAVLLIFGSKKIPEFARGLGKATSEFKRGKLEVERQIREEELEHKRKSDKKWKEEEKKLVEDEIDEKVLKAAKELGIDSEGKTEKELKKEIAAIMAD